MGAPKAGFVFSTAPHLRRGWSTKDEKTDKNRKKQQKPRKQDRASPRDFRQRVGVLTVFGLWESPRKSQAASLQPSPRACSSSTLLGTAPRRPKGRLRLQIEWWRPHPCTPTCELHFGAAHWGGSVTLGCTRRPGSPASPGQPSSRASPLQWPKDKVSVGEQRRARDTNHPAMPFSY